MPVFEHEGPTKLGLIIAKRISMLYRISIVMLHAYPIAHAYVQINGKYFTHFIE